MTLDEKLELHLQVNLAILKHQSLPARVGLAVCGTHMYSQKQHHIRLFQTYICSL
jgi:hypothetical protein